MKEEGRLEESGDGPGIASAHDRADGLDRAVSENGGNRAGEPRDSMAQQRGNKESDDGDGGEEI